MSELRRDFEGDADQVWETHISWVFAIGGEVLKVKKPVDFGFLDFSTLEKRRAACEAEDRLNRRLAPDVYLGVVPITRDGDGKHVVDGEGEVVDWAVRMRRLDEGHRADRRLERGGLDREAVDRIAERIAAFHAEARTDEETARFGSPELIGGNVRENFEQTRDVLTEILSRDEAEEIERWQLRFLEERAALFEARVEAGRVRDGHGDLRLEHVYLEGDGEIRVIDCIEFNERFRYADVGADLAFLSMDLAWHGRVDLAERVLATYARETSDFDLFPLIDFYESYRAYVRGKVAVMLAADEDAAHEVRERARGQARRYFRLALAMERRSLLGPALVAIGGPIASGKSTLADHLGFAMGAPAINSDRIRKHMLGAQPTDKLYEGSWSGAYDPAFTEKVYAEVERLAKAVLSSGRPVILDASFRSRVMREDARKVARSMGVPFFFVECRLDPEVCRERLRIRDTQTTVSDGRLEIFDDFLARWEPVDELDAGEHHPVDTARPIAEVIDDLRGALPIWPDDLTA